VDFISYSQNQEDVLLHLALGDVEKGFYIDIGASDPQIDSVTKNFYDRGWTGINVEPAGESFQKFLVQRPLDINIRSAIGAQNGTAQIYISQIPGRHSLNPENAKYLTEKLRIEEVEMLTLNNLLEKYLKPQQVIHFLKVDVEGFEREVLLGLDLNTYRPWLLIMESLNPITKNDESSNWEKLITDSNYIFAHFDGLNRYYLEKSQSHRLQNLSRVNVLLADFTPYSLYEASRQSTLFEIASNSLEIELSTAQTRERSLEIELSTAQTRERSLEIELSTAQTRERSLQQELSTAQARERSLEQELSTAQTRERSLEISVNEYHLLLSSKLFRYTRSIRRFYFYLIFFLSKKNTRYSKISMVSQYLKRYPKTRARFIDVYYKLQRSWKVFLKKRDKKLKNDNFEKSKIQSANLQSLVRSFE
jgi:FkbM family methyltransferase